MADSASEPETPSINKPLGYSMVSVYQDTVGKPEFSAEVSRGEGIVRVTIGGARMLLLTEAARHFADELRKAADAADGAARVRLAWSRQGER